VIVESSWHETESGKGIRGSMMVHETLHQESNEQKQSRMLHSCHLRLAQPTLGGIKHVVINAHAPRKAEWRIIQPSCDHAHVD